ncbi:hypothetical protein [Marinobacter sp. BGYM27]|uniref:hypothetical protein n=1 Tax=Marinobacter sp. BGYM27 TaxID=2975597 RepID=UPI0021A8CE09|nr:hypothetical protein [Marinobacter sp. BGYM27]MDG5498943.1 hypothetical protein [Marinobacter sp. BGYM27]
MNDIIDHDVAGKPIRTGDVCEVVNCISHPDRNGLLVVVLGSNMLGLACGHLETIEVIQPDGIVACTRPDRLRILPTDRKAASESFAQIVESMKQSAVPA